MGTEGVMSVKWTRAELVAVREAIEVTPLFDGRADVRTAVHDALRANRRVLVLERELAERLATHLVPVDMHIAIAKVKLLRADPGDQARARRRRRPSTPRNERHPRSGVFAPRVTPTQRSVRRLALSSSCSRPFWA